jgi:methionyl-tRNA formyltransferase
MFVYEREAINLDITLFIMTAKGYHFLKDVLPAYKSMFRQVVVGKDASLENDFESEILELCGEHNIEVTLRENFERVSTTFAMAISWRWIIEHPPLNLVVFHDSLLPKYRGFAPLVASLINGEQEIGVTALFGEKEFDRGDIIFQSASRIRYPLTIAQAITINRHNYFRCAEHVLQILSAGDDLLGKKQSEESASYSIWRDQNDYQINWNQSAERISRHVDASGDPYAGAFTALGTDVVRVLRAEPVADVSFEIRQPGKIWFLSPNDPVVVCGTGLLRIKEAVIETPTGPAPFLPITRLRIRFAES